MSLDIGRTQTLRAHRRATPGVYLRAGDEEVLLPNREVPAGLELGSDLEVFVYMDSEDRPVATTRRPLAEVGEFACLEVVDVGPQGAFLDWGLPKDLLLPRSEQHQPPSVGQAVVVLVLQHEKSRRLFASSRVNNYLDPAPEELQSGQSIEFFAVRHTPLGVLVIVDDRYEGMVHLSRTSPKLEVGQRGNGYVARVRDDGKLDVQLGPVGAQRRLSEVDRLLELLVARNGWLPLTDQSEPEAIVQEVGMSKKAFKRALGQLYRARKVLLEETGVRLVPGKPAQG